MTEFKTCDLVVARDDVCSLEVTVIESTPSGVDVRVDGSVMLRVWSKDLTLIRRAPVDLATCDLSERVWVKTIASGAAGILLSRGVNKSGTTFAMIEWGPGSVGAVPLASLRPLDAPAPAPDQSDMAAEIARLRNGLTLARDRLYKLSVETDEAWGPAAENWAKEATEALASTAPACAEKGRFAWLWFGQDEKDEEHLSFGRWARHPSQRRYKLAETQATEHDHPTPTCPPCHILINGRAVPEEFMKVAWAAKEFLDDWKKGDFSLSTLAALDAQSLSDAMTKLSDVITPGALSSKRGDV